MNAEPRSGHFTSQRLRLHYSEWGDPAAPPLILQHGGRDHGRSWDDLVPVLLPRWRIIAPDLRGHGDSQWSPDASYGMNDYLYDHAMLFDALEIESAVVIGHSLGGNIALRHAAIRPDRVEKLVLIEGLGPSPKVYAERMTKPITERLGMWIEQRRRGLARQRRVYPSIDEAVARMHGENPHFSSDLARRLTINGTERVDGGYCFKADPAMAALAPHDVSWDERRVLREAIACDTLLIYGAESWASNPVTDGRAADFPRVRTEIIDNAGHWAHHDRPGEFVALIRSFL
jgi:pimeloyl-ACP methyl ester carboxylesterase